MYRVLLAFVMSLTLSTAVRAQSPNGDLARLLAADLAKYPAKAGVYVKNLRTGEEAMVNADQGFSSASVIKIPIMIRAFQLADQHKLNLDERVEITRATLRDGTGVYQYLDMGLKPTVRDLITQMIITSDNTATDLMTTLVGGVDSLNTWLAVSGYTQTRMVSRGYEYRRKLLAVLNPEFASLTAEETTALQYAATDNPLFDLYAPLFSGERAKWVALVRDPAQRAKLADARSRLTVRDRSYWLGNMTPRETARLLEGIERGTLASASASATMRTMLRRQQLGVRRIPHYLDVPVAHKTGDGPTIANDVGMVYARSGTVLIAFFTNDITGQYGEAEDMIGRTSRKIIDYFDRVSAAR
ncbi:serine hydrolase [Gemmatimonas sp.]|uniref:serine hydrolase n=1 Tax=Gemmatimonas sp. TaxID=1962908 RepID=UPI003341D044